MNQRITIQEPAESSHNAYGETTDSWTDLVTVWGEVTELSGRELLNAAQIQPEVKHKVVIRYRDDITSAMRVKYGTRYLYITSSVPDDAKFQKPVGLVLLCTEKP